jgi:SSS family solute:Na+ symporter
MGFTNLDYAILAIYLVATATFGALVGRGQKDIRDYFLGGRHMSWWAISLSIVATETSTLTFIGAPAIAFAGDLTFLQVAFGYMIGKILVSFVLIPGYFRGELQTAYELLNSRFGSKIRSFAALIFQVTRALADGVRLFATALVLSVVTQISDFWTIVIIGAVTVIYTYFGGMTGVVWNDVIQLFVYLAGAVLSFVILLDKIPGGWVQIHAVATAAGKFDLVNLHLNLYQPYTLLAGLLGGAFLTFATHGTDQMMVQRYLACGDKRRSQIALILSGGIVILQFWLFLVIGVMLFVFYQQFPLHEELGQVNRIFPIFIVQEMPAGVSGLIIAAIFAAAMSTLSSSLNSLSSSFINDFYRARIHPGATERHYLTASRLLTLAWGAVLVVVSLFARNWGEVLQTGLTITSVTMGSMLGIFLLGILSRRVGERAGLVAMGAGLATMLILTLTSQVAWTWYAFAGTTITVAVGLALQAVLDRA